MKSVRQKRDDARARRREAARRKRLRVLEREFSRLVDSCWITGRMTSREDMQALSLLLFTAWSTIRLSSEEPAMHDDVRETLTHAGELLELTGRFARERQVPPNVVSLADERARRPAQPRAAVEGECRIIDLAELLARSLAERDPSETAPRPTATNVISLAEHIARAKEK